MIAAWSWIAANAGWLSAISGLLSAFVLAWPLASELPKRRRHDVVLIVKRKSIEQKPKPSARPGFEDDSKDIETIEGEMTSDRMGGYHAAARTVIFGLGLLALSFLLALIAALNKN